MWVGNRKGSISYADRTLFLVPPHLPTYPPTHLPTYPPTHLPTYPIQSAATVPKSYPGTDTRGIGWPITRSMVRTIAISSGAMKV